MFKRGTRVKFIKHSSVAGTRTLPTNMTNLVIGNVYTVILEDIWEGPEFNRIAVDGYETNWLHSSSFVLYNANDK